MKTYRMYRGTMVEDRGWGSGFHGATFKSTARIFKARTQKEATAKMDKFIRDAQITGSFFVKEIYS